MQYVALLRGIGPTNPNMRGEKLRGVVEALGFDDVRTVISTGNVIFTAPHTADRGEIEARVEAAWPDQLGFTSTTILRTREDIDKIVAADPFAAHVADLASTGADVKSSALQVTFMQHPTDVELELPHTPDSSGFTVVAADARTTYTVVDLDTSGSPDAMRWLEKTFGKRITTRTWATVNRIANKFG